MEFLVLYDPVVKKIMVKINSMPRNTEILLHNEPWTPYIDELGKMALHLRKLYLPHQVFGKCSILRGTLGEFMSVRNVDDLACVVMWRKFDEKKTIVCCVYAFISFFSIIFRTAQVVYGFVLAREYNPRNSSFL